MTLSRSQATVDDPAVGGGTATAVVVPAPGREVLAGMGDAYPDHGVRMAESIHARVEELEAVSDRARMFAETEGSCTANIEQILSLLRSGRPASDHAFPEAAERYAIGLVHRRVSMTSMLHSYRVGQNFLWTTASRHLQAEVGDAEVVLDTLHALSSFLFEYVDLASTDLVDTYQQERDRWIRTAAAVRAETARELLDGRTIDEQTASSRLGYELRGHHVGLIVVGDATGGDDLRSLEKEAIEAAGTLGCGDPLLVPAGASTLWAWCRSLESPSRDAIARLERHLPREGVRLAIGRPAYGIEGFRVTHVEAQYAADLWRQSPASTGRTVSYAAVELVSLLASDVTRARRFVIGELGALADPQDGTARLRETLLSFLAHGGSHTLAAQALHLHKNTVYTRVRRAEAILGVPISHRRIELQTALMLATTLGDEVLVQDG
ncbi:MAG: helix-turn-helix domain-containing protein [Solirubrobacteraceae bacterium]|nr:helix-turn-helix domain-containing protein [Solirubrobacteraceae bacterium]